MSISKLLPNSFAASFLLLVFVLFAEVSAQSFSQNSIDFNGFETVNNGTSIMYGPDGRLYITEYTGAIKVYTIERTGPGSYVVQDLEVLTDIYDIQDYNDDGTLYSSTFRETIGITVTGTATNPVFYVTSSDFRIGGGGGGGSGDQNLDTNSGIITRFSWNGTSWDVVDIVRGLPRSEENHATNGLEFVTVNGIDYLIVAQGGHTNAGAPSQNFAYTTEYALSAAVLSINLTQLEAMPILDDNGRKYIYDIPTVDDPSRPNVNGIIDPDVPGYDGIDVNDPWGGNDGLNQAMIVPGGPVQIFSPGYRNAYDLVVTESGAVYVTDNGANGGWGGFPVNEGSGLATNDYDPAEPGSSTAIDGEQVNNKDHLSLVTTDIQNYTFGSFYGGHPTPIRANPSAAGLYTNPSVTGTTGAVFRTLKYHPTKVEAGYTQDPNLGLPANWPPVPVANPVEGDWRGPDMNNPDGPNDAVVTSWGTNTNAIDEYTASNFEGAMKGNLLAGVNNGNIRRVELNADGSLKTLTSSFFSGLGGNALGVTCNSDTDIFPGTIWVVTLEGILTVMEPQDFGDCILPGEEGYDALADYDFDGYTNQDEQDNGTDACNGGSQPQDFDKAAGGSLISDINDLDDDTDGIQDKDDPFQLGDFTKTGSDAFSIPVSNELFSSNTQLKGYLGLGMTGLMNNGDANPNWLNWIDRRDDPADPNPNDILGGAIGAMTMQMTSGTAYGTTNTQEKAFQYGVQTDLTTGVFTVAGGIFNFSAPLQLYGNTSAPNGELGFFIGDGTQSNYIKFIISPQGLVAQQEINDIPETPINLDLAIAERPTAGVNFYFEIDPATGIINLDYSLDDGLLQNLGSITVKGSILEAIQQNTRDLAVGFIGTSNAEGVEVEGTWDFLNVTSSKPGLLTNLPDIERTTSSPQEAINLEEYFFDDQGAANLVYTVQANSDPSIIATISGSFLNLSYPSTPAVSDITIRATDSDNNFVEDSFTVTVIQAPSVLYRVNAGGVVVASIDEEMDWSADSSVSPSPYLSEPGTGGIYNGTIVSLSGEVDGSTTPLEIFKNERYDGSAGIPNLSYTFPVAQEGNYEVRLYMGNGWSGTSEPGTRIFDVAIEGVVHPSLNDIDLSARFGHQVGGVISQVVNITDGAIDISFIHGVQNPLVNGIEILSYSGPIETPITVASILDQTNYVNDALDGSLAVSASGGDGNLTYSMEGAPAGVSIEPTNGQIGGTIAPDADLSSPYTVTVYVNDSDGTSSDEVSVVFQWFINGTEPVVSEEIPDMVRSVGSLEEEIDLHNYFSDDLGTENLIYTIEQNTDTSIGATISGNVLALTFPNIPTTTSITIRATDSDNNFVEDTFQVTVNSLPLVLYRVNAGGPAITSIDSEINWAADNLTSPSIYLSEPGTGSVYNGTIINYTAEVDQESVPTNIFNSERYDNIPGTPNLTYSFPVTVPGNYEIRLYMGNGYSGTSQPGTRLFDVSIENIIYSNLDDLDLSATFGHQTGGMISYVVSVTDGFIDISFIHEKENPVINGIEIINALDSPLPIQVWEIADQINYRGEELDGSLAVQASGGDGTLTYSVEGAPPGVSINSTTGVLTGTISPEADFTIPYQVKVIVDDNDSDLTDFAERSFFWTITESAPLSWIDKNESENYTGRHECSFVQAGDKFYLVGGRESAKTLDIYDYNSNTWTSVIDSAPFEFNHYQATEYQGLIWVIGAFKTNGFPDEIPADYIWVFDPATQEWIQVMEIPLDRRRGSAGLVMYNDKFYITGGNNLGHNGGYVSWFDEYDPKTGVWTSLADAPRARDHFHSAVIGDKLYLAGGRLSGGTGGTFKPLIPEIDVYDFTTSSWSTLPVDKNIPTPRAAASAVNFKGKLVVIGGEVDNEVIDGATVSDALKITEEYDPITGNWTRLADLNYERHGTQAIVSGDGIFTLAGSPNRGGGSQKNMEYLGEDAPVGSPSVTSSLTGPEKLSLLAGSEGEIQLEVLNGNVGLIITSAVISGPNAENFQIISGNISGALWKPNSTNTISVSHLGNQALESATLTINYGLNGQFAINLETVEGIVLDPLPDQTNSLGDQLDGSLIASASGGEGELTYTMTGAPADVVIDPVTGIISGSINADAVNGSPYTVNITVDDADLTDTDAVNTSFTWTILLGEPVVIQAIGDIEAFTNDPGIDYDLNNYFDDNNGAENLVYSITENTNQSISANITGSTLNITFPSNPAVSQITVRATDEFGNFNGISFQVSVLEDPNLAPVVSITAPADGANFIVPGDILITADATDTDGSITQVEFFEGTTSLGIDTDGSDGWSFSWTGVGAGSYALTAIATDDDLTSSTSEIVTITVEDPNVLPTISITSPLNNDTFTAPAEILITADAADLDGVITQVEFFEGTNSLGIDTDGSDGWSVNWTGVLASNYKLSAIATDDDLHTTTSEIVSITVEEPNVLPTVVITSPMETDSFRAPADLLIAADASDADGSIAQVEFFVGANSLGIDTDGSDGWSFNWTGVGSGSYGLTAVAIDNKGGSTTSSVINIGVDNALPSAVITSPLETDSFTAPADILITADASDADGSITQVEFFEGAKSLGIDTDGSDGWSFNWTGVGSGSYALTAIATDNDGASTTSSVINIGVDNALPTVVITSPLETDSFTALADILIAADASDADGSIAQVEFFVGANSLGIDTDGSDGWSFNWTGVGSGSYGLTAVAIDNEGGSTTSSVINIGVDNALPSAVITSPLETDSFTAPANILITADASDADGSITQVEFFEGTTSLGIDTDGTDGWSFSWIGVDSGTYNLTAVATDDDGATTTSSVINIGVDNALPTVAITSPLETDSFTAPADILITANSSDADGSIAQVEFFEETTSLGIDTDGSDGWSFNWTGVGSGSYALTAIATDNDGASTTSSVVSIGVDNALPTVVITSPLETDSFTAPADILIAADASDADGSIAQVEFFEETTSLGIDTDGSDGWSFNWTGVGSGSYALTAIATDNNGATTTSAVINIGVDNALPTVVITSPLETDSFTAPADILITADASDADGSITQVEFFEGANSLGIDTDGSDGWSFNWTGVVAGTYELIAVATDDDLASTTSALVTITVEEPNVLPTVTITAPLNNDIFTAPADILITADASDADGSINQVEFFQGTTSIGIDPDGSDGWSVNWTGVDSGSYSLTAVATDDDLESSTSEIISFTVETPNALPSVTITSPTNNATFTSPATINITANATDSDGTVIAVEFYEGSNFLGQDIDGSNGWSFNWTGVVSNSYSLTAVAIDDEGASATSAAISITVSEPLPAITNFIPSIGPVGSVVVINGTNLGGVNQVSFGPSVAEIISVTATQIEVRVPPVNGKLPKDVKITLSSTAGSFTSANKFTITAGTPQQNINPVVSIISPANNTVYTAPASINILANASDSDGTVTKVEFFSGTTKLGEDLTAPYEFDWTNVAAGNYALTAKATDDRGAVTTSAVINVQVGEPGGNAAPVVSITSPVNNSSYTSPASFAITATASDIDGSVTQVEFFNGSVSLGIDQVSPYEVNWNNVTEGTYLLTAIATDNLGAVTTSGVVTVTVNPSVTINAPTNLNAQWISNSQVSLTWQDNSFDEDGFVLERSSKQDFTGRVDQISLPANSTSYIDSGLNSNKAGGTLYYRIRAVRGNLFSAYSNSVLASTLLSTSTELDTSTLNSGLAVSPNPTSGDATVKFTLTSNSPYSLSVYDGRGAYLFTISEGSAKAGVEHSFELDLNNYPEATYIIVLETNYNRESLKLLVRR